jgi:hypothetical protein
MLLPCVTTTLAFLLPLTAAAPKKPSGMTYCTQANFTGICNNVLSAHITQGAGREVGFEKCMQFPYWTGSFAVGPWTECTLYPDGMCAKDLVVQTLRLGGNNNVTSVRDISQKIYVQGNDTKGPWMAVKCVASDKYLWNS